ncbi:MAG: AI-2E family transporter [Planctomycetota bacterium]
MDAKLYRTLLLFAATIAVLYGFVLVLRPFLVPIAWALCFAAMTHRPYRAHAARTGKPNLSALVLVVLTMLVLVVPVGLVILLAGEELVNLGKGGLGQWVESLKSALPHVYVWLDVHLKRFGIEGLDVATQRAAAAAPAMLWGPVASGAWSIVGGVFETLMDFVIVFATQFFVYTGSSKLHDAVTGLSPLPREDTAHILATLRDTTSAAVLGGILVAFIQGMLGGIGFAIVGIQAPVLWGLVMALFSLLPMGGAAFVWAPVAIYLFAVGDVGKAWFLFAWGLLLVGAIDNVLRPWILRRTGSQVHPMLLFFAILSGIGLFGMSGIVFGPLLIALVLTAMESYRKIMA